MTRRISGSGGSDFDMRFFGGSFLAFLFFIGMLLCVRFMIALLWEKDYPNLQLYSNIMCFIGIVTGMIFAIAGWAQDCFEKYRWGLIAATVLTITVSILYWFGYTFTSLVSTALIFLILGLYFLPSMKDMPENQLG